MLLGIVPDNALILKNDVDRRKALQFLDGLVHLFRLDFGDGIRFVAVGHGHIENRTDIIIAVDPHKLRDAFCPFVYAPPEFIPVSGGQYGPRLRQGLQHKCGIAGCDMAAKPPPAVQIVGKALAILHNFLQYGFLRRNGFFKFGLLFGFPLLDG